MSSVGIISLGMPGAGSMVVPEPVLCRSQAGLCSQPWFQSLCLMWSLARLQDAFLCGTGLSLLQGTSPALPPGRTGISLVFAGPGRFLSSLRKEKLLFPWGLPFRCCLSYPTEQEADGA